MGETTRSERRNLLWTSSTYFGEGLPYSFLHQLVTEYLTGIGAARGEIGYTSLFHGTIALKPLVSPIIDERGARRGTMLVTQIVIGLLMIASTAVVSETIAGRSEAITLAFWIGLGVIATIHAVHDLACDGFFIVALTDTQHARYAGTRLAAYRTAMYVGSALMLLLAARTDWRTAFIASGVLMTCVGAFNFLVVPRVSEPIGTARGDASGTWKLAYRSLFSQPHIALVLAFVISYRLGDVLTFAMSPPLLRELGMDTEARGYLRMVSLTASIGGSILAGWLLARGGLRRWFAPFTYVMAMPLYLLLAILRPGFWGIAAVVIVEQFAGSLAGVALPYFMIQRSRREFSAAHYGFFSACTAAVSTVVGTASGHLNEAIGNVAYFALCFVVAIPALILVHMVPTAPLEPDAVSQSTG